MGEKRLADVFSVEDLNKISTKGVCIFSGVGSGKNYFVENHLFKAGNIFYVTSRRAKVDEIIASKFCEDIIDWSSIVIDKPVVMTFAKVEQILKSPYIERNISKILEGFDYVVIDEAHALATDSSYADSAFHVLKFVEFALKSKSIKKTILMTGTPDPLLKYLEFHKKENTWTICNFINECKNIRPKEMRIISKESAYKLIANEKKTAYMTNSASGIGTDKAGLISNFLKKSGLRREEIFYRVSEQADKKREVDERIENRESFQEMIETGEIPDGKRLLLCTSTLREGVNIMTEDIENIYCESHLLEEIQQFAGRFRSGVKCIYIIEETCQHHVHKADWARMTFDGLYLKKVANDFYKDLYLMGRDALSTVILGKMGESPEDIQERREIIETFGDRKYIETKTRDEFINAVNNSKGFLRFDYITRMFAIWDLKAQEQQRQSEYYKKGWKRALDEYCKANNIIYADETYLSFDEKKDAIRAIVEKYQGRELASDEKGEFKMAMNRFKKTNREGLPQVKTINNIFEEYDVPYVVKVKKTNSKRFWIVEKKEK